MRDIPGYEGLYAATEDGRIWSYPKSCGRNRVHKGKFLQPVNRGNGYLCVTLPYFGKRLLKSVHILVALAYIDNPENKPEINHKNGIKTDNRLENLEWYTKSENAIHSYKVLKNEPSNKRKVMQLTKEGILCKVYDSAYEAERITGLWQSNISSCALGRRGHGTCGGYHWQYA